MRYVKLQRLNLEILFTKNWSVLAGFHPLLGWLRMFENRMLKRIFWSRKVEWLEGGENCIMRSFIICTPYWIPLGWLSQGYNGQGMCMETMRNIQKIWLESLMEETIRRPNCRWGYNTNMYFREIRHGQDWSALGLGVFGQSESLTFHEGLSILHEGGCLIG
jgi:hypothetical protein